MHLLGSKATRIDRSRQGVWPVTRSRTAVTIDAFGSTSADLTALEFVGKALVINTQQVHDSSLEVVNVNFVLDSVETKFVGRTVAKAWLYAAPSHP